MTPPLLYLPSVAQTVHENELSKEYNMIIDIFNICNWNSNWALTVAVCFAVASIMTGAAIFTALASYDIGVFRRKQ